MPTPHKPSKFLLQTLAIIAIISLSIPATTFAITSNSGTSQAKSTAGSSRDSGTRAPAGTGNSGNASKPSTGGGVNRNNQSGASRSGAGYGTSKPVSSGSSGSSIQTGGSRASGGASDRNSVPGYSGGSRSGGDTGGQGGGGNDSGSRNGTDGSRSGAGTQSPITRIAAAVRTAVTAAVNVTIDGAKSVLNSAKKTAGLPSGGGFGELPGSIEKPAYTEPDRNDRQPSTPPKQSTNVPDQIREQMEKQKVANGGLTDAQVREYEKMNLEEAKRGFQKELKERAEGIYSLDEAKRAADNKANLDDANPQGGEEGEFSQGDTGDEPTEEQKNDRDASVPQSLLDKYKAPESDLPEIPEPDRKTPGALSSEQEQELIDKAREKVLEANKLPDFALPGADPVTTPAPDWTKVNKVSDYAAYVPSLKQAQEDPAARPAGINNQQTDYERIKNADKKYQEAKIAGDVGTIKAAQKERDDAITAYNTKYQAPTPKPADTSVKLIRVWDDPAPITPPPQPTTPKEPGVFAKVAAWTKSWFVTPPVAVAPNVPKIAKIQDQLPQEEPVDNNKIPKITDRLPGDPIENPDISPYQDLKQYVDDNKGKPDLSKIVAGEPTDTVPKNGPRVGAKPKDYSQDESIDYGPNDIEKKVQAKNPGAVDENGDVPVEKGYTISLNVAGEGIVNTKYAGQKDVVMSNDEGRIVKGSYGADGKLTTASITFDNKVEADKYAEEYPDSLKYKSDEMVGTFPSQKVKQDVSGLPKPEILKVSDVNADIEKLKKYGPIGDNPTIPLRTIEKVGDDTPEKTDDDIVYKEPVMDIVKLKQLNSVSLKNPSPRVNDGINDREIKSVEKIIEDAKENDGVDIYKNIAINYIPAAERTEEKKKEFDSLKPEEVRLAAVLANQAEVINYTAPKVNLKPSDLSPEEKADLLVIIAAKETHFKATDIGAGVKNSRTGEDLETGIIDTSYNANPREYKITGPMSLPLLGNFDKNIKLVEGAIDTPEKVRDLIMKQAVDVYGLPKNVGAALVGNVAGESDYNPDVTNEIGAQGLFQYVFPTRVNSLKEFAKKANADVKGVNLQVAHAIAELDGTSPIVDAKAKSVGNAIKKNPNMSVDDATFLIMDKFENPSEEDKKSSIAKRKEEAKKALEAYNNDFSQETEFAPREKNVDEENTDQDVTAPPKKTNDKKVSEAFEEATTIDDKDPAGVKFGKTVLKAGMPKTLLVAGDAAVGFVGLIGQLFGVDLSLSPGGTGKPPLSDEDRALGSGGYSGVINDVNQNTEKTLDASQFTPAQNTQTLVNNVLTLNSSNVTSFIPSPDSTEAKTGLIRRITTTINKTTYIVELRSRLTLSGKFIVVNATPNVSGAKVTFSYTDNGPDGSLDAFSANGVNLTGSAISKEVRNKFEEELRTLTNLYYKSL